MGPKIFRSIFEKRAPANFLGVPLLSLAKSIYYFVFKPTISMVFIKYARDCGASLIIRYYEDTQSVLFSMFFIACTGHLKNIPHSEMFRD